MSDPVDQSERERIKTHTDRTLFVSAGAGSGKTSSLVDRVAQLVLHDGVAMEHIATVTFTIKAAAELRDRLRARFEKTLADASDSEVLLRAEAALEQLDVAAIGTLHSFGQRILTAHPIEAGIPPALEVLDEVGSSIAFEERWARIQRDRSITRNWRRPSHSASPLASSSSTFGSWSGCSDRTGTGSNRTC